MSIEHHGRGYTPLPQSMSNTDTEDDEDENLQTIIEPNRENTDAQVATESRGFYPLDETRNPINRFKNRQNTLRCYPDDLPMMVIENNDSNDLWKNREMSPIRQFFFGVSILICFITIFVFLYVLPCDNTVVCQLSMRPAIVWEKTLHGVEFLGPMSMAQNSIIFLLRGQQYGERKDKNITITTFTSQRETPEEESLIIAMRENDGAILWRRPLHKLATALDCNSITVVESQPPDCIVVGEQGLLTVIESVTGIIRWTSTINTFSKLPVILPDINKDNAKDILTVEIVSANVSHPVIISGETGKILKRYSKAGNCFLIDINSFVINQSISCKFYNNKGQIDMKYISREELLDDAPTTIRQSISRPINFSSEYSSEKYNVQHDWALSSYHRLFIENEGNCPGELCGVKLNLTFQLSPNESSIFWKYEETNVIMSKPTILPNTSPYISRFVIKIWQWDNYNYSLNRVTEQKLLEKISIVTVNRTQVPHFINISQTDVIQFCHDNRDCQPNFDTSLPLSTIAVMDNNIDSDIKLINYFSSYNVETPNTLTSKVQVIKLSSASLSMQ